MKFMRGQVFISSETNSIVIVKLLLNSTNKMHYIVDFEMMTSVLMFTKSVKNMKTR